MPVKVPAGGQLAFRGNIRRALQKFIGATNSILTWSADHDNWPVDVFTNQQLIAMQALASNAKSQLTAKIPGGP